MKNDIASCHIAHQLMIVALLCALLAISMFQFVESDEEGRVSKMNIKAQRAALKTWADSLEELDYNSTNWAATMRHMPSNYFEHYAERLSNIFKDKGASVNFVLVGACDGTNDRTIRDRFIPNEHWRAVFVEPFQMNFKDLSNFMEEHKVSHRAHLVHGAATRKCNESMIKMKRPTFEEKNKSLPHWMRRQIGAVVPYNKLSNKMTGGWVAEYTRCVNGMDILNDWTTALNRQHFPSAVMNKLEDSETTNAQGEANSEAGAAEARRQLKKGKKKGGTGKGMIKRIRPHILKVDVEGHDYEVLMGFLGKEIPQALMPMMINFEAKSVSGKWTDIKETMEGRGYAVSEFANDGFALLKAAHVFAGKRGGGGGGGGKKKRNQQKKKQKQDD